MLWNRVFMGRNAQIWAVKSSYEADLLMLRNPVFRPKRSDMGIAVLVGGRFDDIREFFFQAAKRSDMDFAEQQVRLLADCQEWFIVAAKCSC